RVIGQCHAYPRRDGSEEVAEQVRSPGIAVVDVQREVGHQLAVGAGDDALRDGRLQVWIDHVRRRHSSRVAWIEAVLCCAWNGSRWRRIDHFARLNEMIP